MELVSSVQPHLVPEAHLSLNSPRMLATSVDVAPSPRRTVLSPASGAWHPSSCHRSGRTAPKLRLRQSRPNRRARTTSERTAASPHLLRTRKKHNVAVVRDMRTACLLRVQSAPRTRVISGCMFERERAARGGCEARCVGWTRTSAPPRSLADHRGEGVLNLLDRQVARPGDEEAPAAHARRGPHRPPSFEAYAPVTAFPADAPAAQPNTEPAMRPVPPG